MNHILIDCLQVVKPRSFSTLEAAERMSRQMELVDSTHYAMYHGTPRFYVMSLDQVSA